ncbi:MAG: hypothetical protein JSS59_01865 [Proteobacteria bacterium]|uniref:hypothetical protein n=1 Tax=Rudaea sp. TaxID=2136325 RepID=UPI003782E371|nr:hypothetical protein [Pseudomonadota bacterium]
MTAGDTKANAANATVAHTRRTLTLLTMDTSVLNFNAALAKPQNSLPIRFRENSRGQRALAAARRTLPAASPAGMGVTTTGQRNTSPLSATARRANSIDNMLPPYKPAQDQPTAAAPNALRRGFTFFATEPQHLGNIRAIAARSFRMT